MKKLLILVSLFFLRSSYATSRSIGVIAALPQELETLKAELTSAKVVKHGTAEFVVGNLANIPVVSTLSGVGKVNAAIAGQRMISDFSVKAIFFTGVAGGLNPQYEIGDVVILSQAFQHDFGFLDQKFVLHAVGTLPEIGIGKGDEPIRYD